MRFTDVTDLPLDPSVCHSMATVRIVYSDIIHHSKQDTIVEVQSKGSERSPPFSTAITDHSNSLSTAEGRLNSSSISTPLLSLRQQAPRKTSATRASISARDFLAFTRVQNQVAKNSVFSFIDTESHEPVHIVSNFVYVSQRLQL